jgi:hypothetical protein
MKSTFLKRTLRDLALAIGLASVLIALLLVCAAESAPPIAASPGHGDLWPAWTSTEPVTTNVTFNRKTWYISEYGVTVTFNFNSVTAPAVFTFAPQSGIKLDPPLISTPYVFDFYGTWEDTGKLVSLLNKVNIALQYEEANLGRIPENTLGAFFLFVDDWLDQDATVNEVDNVISWQTPWTGRFGIGGLGSRTYLPVVLDASSSLGEPAGTPPVE